MVSGGVDDDVEVDLATVGGHNPVGVHLGGFTGFDVDMLAGQRGVIATGIANDALAIGCEVGCDLAGQFRSGPEHAVDVVQAHLQQDIVGRGGDRQVRLRPLGSCRMIG